MFERLINLLGKKTVNATREVVRHTFFKDPFIADVLFNEGYCVIDLLTNEDKDNLIEAYQRLKIDSKQTKGKFYPILNHATNSAINDILRKTVSSRISNYKSVSAFVVKTPGEDSIVPIHQDLAVLDEEKYSLLHVFIPLTDINNKNGALQIIPRTHHIFLPYRCGTIKPIFDNIKSELMPYFIPIHLNFGQALFFDSRLFHYSTPNRSDIDRVVAVCRISPTEAEYVTYYKDNSKNTTAIEAWERPKDYLITKVENIGEEQRPTNAKFLGYKYANTSPITYEEFNMICRIRNIYPAKLL